MTSVNPSAELIVDAQGEKLDKKFLEFLQNFHLAPGTPGYNEFATEEEKKKKKPIKYYEHLAKELKDNDKQTLYVDFEHLAKFDESFELREAILGEYYRYDPYIRKSVRQFMRSLAGEHAKDNKAYYCAFYNLSSIEK